MTPRPTGKRLHALVVVTAALAMLLGGVFLTTPIVEAQTPGAEYTADFPDFSPPPAGLVCNPIGTITLDASGAVNGDWCRPEGFSPIDNLGDCLGISAFFDIPAIYDVPTRGCFIDIYNDGATMCEAPSVLVDGTDQVFISGGVEISTSMFAACALPGLFMLPSPVTPPPPVLPPVPPSTSMVDVDAIASAVCIESPEVQDDDAAAHLGVGQDFIAASGGHFLITTGAPLCEFTGAGCSPTLNLNSVEDVRTCLGLAAGPAAGVAEDTASASVPASVPAAQPVGQLAVTGEEHEFGAAFAGALVGTGLSVLGLVRLLHTRRRDD